ncbi:phage minor capsid protein [Nonomuraea sp. NPDC050404]|uniref:phage minor capsid protein n=1 Tax=Nonomuraea sp. NPDC050404 TaxID=3155783 RepID=UPI00340736EC
MAIDEDQLDRISATVADLFRSVESAVNRALAARLRDGLAADPLRDKADALAKLRRSTLAIQAAMQERSAPAIRQAIADAYAAGRGGALTDLPEQWFPRSGIGQDAAAAAETVPNVATVERLAGALHADMGHVSRNVLRNVLDAYRAVQTESAARIASGAFTRRQAAQAVWQRLMDKGITSFTDSRGRRWSLSAYAEMMTRTNVKRAAVEAHNARLAEVGLDLIYVQNVTQECRLCRPYEGKVLSIGAGARAGEVQVEHSTRDGEMVTVTVVATLNEAREKGLHHPNCRHSISAYLPGVTKLPTSTEDPEGNKARERQRAIERAIRKYKERAETALTPEAKKDAEQRVRDWQGVMRDHLKANPKLKRLPYRERPGAGNIPTRRGPEGGAVGDQTPARQLDITGAERPLPTSRPAPEPEPAREAPAAPRVPGQLGLDDIKPEPKRGRLSDEQYRALGDEDLAERFNRALADGDEAEIERAAVEMARRDGAGQDEQPAQEGGSWGTFNDERTPDEQRVDDLVSQGWDYVEAYADVHGLDPEALRREERRAALDSERQSGETLDQTVARLYRDWVHTQWLQAEAATNGFLLNKEGERAGIDPLSLFSGPTSRARRYASEELRRWWNSNQRMTLTEFRAQVLDRESDRRAARTTQEMGGAGI